MKRIIALVLSAVMCALLLASCGAKGDFYEIDVNNVSAIHLASTTEYDEAIDRKAFVESCNGGEVGKIAKDGESDDCVDVIVFTLTDSRVVSVFVTGYDSDDFIVSGTDIDKPYHMTSSALSELYLTTIEY